MFHVSEQTREADIQKATLRSQQHPLRGKNASRDAVRAKQAAERAIAKAHEQLQRSTALSRAANRHSQRINSDLALRCPSHMELRLVSDAQSFPYSSPATVPACVQKCKTEMACGHSCSSYCHSPLEAHGRCLVSTKAPDCATHAR